MKIKSKILTFIIIFITIFYGLHNSDIYNKKVILADLGGIPWLYASIGTLFSILAGFIIEKEWENWNRLIDTVNDEVHVLREMWLWSQYLPSKINNIFNDSIKTYLEEMTINGLHKSEQQLSSEKIEKSLANLNYVIFDMFKDEPILAKYAFDFFTKLIDQRNQRIRYSSHHVPKFLKRTIFFTTILMITLSMFIGVKNIWLDFIFTSNLSVLTYVIYLVIDDLDNPLIPGSWNLTSQPYKKLLDEITKK